TRSGGRSPPGCGGRRERTSHAPCPRALRPAPGGRSWPASCRAGRGSPSRLLAWVPLARLVGGQRAIDDGADVAQVVLKIEGPVQIRGREAPRHLGVRLEQRAE